MPEAPEISHLNKYILHNCKNRSLKSVKIMKGRYVKHGAPANFNKFVESLPLKLTDVSKKGKMTVLHFENDWFIISKLGLTGWWYVDKESPKWMNTTPNLQFNFNGKTLYYIDTLSYGTLTFSNDKNLLEKEYNKLAPDVNDVTLNEIIERIDKKPRIQNMLLEEAITDQQAIVSGIGNYLKAEILYEAKISPLRKVSSITKNDWRNILESSKRVIKVKEKSISHDDMDRYEKTMKVYRKDVDPYGNKVEKHKTSTGRTTFWVPTVQK